jgi:hypothetical protein
MVKNKHPVAPLKHLSLKNSVWHSGSSQLPCSNNNEIQCPDTRKYRNDWWSTQLHISIT